MEKTSLLVITFAISFLIALPIVIIRYLLGLIDVPVLIELILTTGAILGFLAVLNEATEFVEKNFSSWIDTLEKSLNKDEPETPPILVIILNGLSESDFQNVVTGFGLQYEEYVGLERSEQISALLNLLEENNQNDSFLSYLRSQESIELDNLANGSISTDKGLFSPKLSWKVMLVLALFCVLGLIANSSQITSNENNGLETSNFDHPSFSTPEYSNIRTPTSSPISIIEKQDTTPSYSEAINDFPIEFVDRFGHEFVLVPEGIFEGQSTNAFYINVYEITNRQFINFLNQVTNNCSNSVICIDIGENAARIFRASGEYQVESNAENLPVVEVTWFGASDYCKWMGGRLPTAQEWRKAAVWNPTNGENLAYPWGNDQDSSKYANINGSNIAFVGTYEQSRSPVGAYDLIGNVWEFTSEESGGQRHWRGGSWTSISVDIYKENSGNGSNTTKADLGFRCVIDTN